MNIPKYRAKTIDNDEYIIGFLTSCNYGQYNDLEEHLIVPFVNFESGFLPNTDFQRIDTTTLSIQLPDMIDSQENRVFASLNEDGKGGDILRHEDSGRTFIAKYNLGKIMLDHLEYHLVKDMCKLKVIGIQK